MNNLGVTLFSWGGQASIDITPTEFQNEPMLDLFIDDDYDKCRLIITAEEALELKVFLDEWLDEITKGR